jgi:hypothetical protein
MLQVIVFLDANSAVGVVTKISVSCLLATILAPSPQSQFPIR